jgi:hypothetical protein
MDCRAGRRDQQSLPLEEAVAALADEATAPDMRRKRKN